VKYDYYQFFDNNNNISCELVYSPGQPEYGMDGRVWMVGQSMAWMVGYGW